MTTMGIFEVISDKVNIVVQNVRLNDKSLIRMGKYIIDNVI